jgi:hypothetical protein
LDRFLVYKIIQPQLIGILKFELVVVRKQAEKQEWLKAMCGVINVMHKLGRYQHSECARLGKLGLGEPAHLH